MRKLLFEHREQRYKNAYLKVYYKGIVNNYIAKDDYNKGKGIEKFFLQ